MFNPKKWNVLCWIMLLIWLYPSVVRNTPRKPVFPKKPSLFTTAYFTGWPLTYLENSQEGFTIVSQKTFRPICLIVNFILIMTTLFGIVFSIQTLMPKFSISTLLIVTSCVGVLVAAANFIYTQGPKPIGPPFAAACSPNFNALAGFVMTIYFLPLLAILPVFIYSRLKPPVDHA